MFGGLHIQGKAGRGMARHGKAKARQGELPLSIRKEDLYSWRGVAWLGMARQKQGKESYLSL